MNPVLMLVRDNFEMTKRAIDSILAQDIPTSLVIVDNSKGDETLNWALENRIEVYPFRPQIGVSKGWNFGLSKLFDRGFEHVLVPNSDVVLKPWTYRKLIEYSLPFVTGVAVDTYPSEEPEVDASQLSAHPDFSLYCIRRDCWDSVGEFNESMFLYVQDCEYHVRAHRLGVPLWKANVAYYHVNSQTMKRALPEERAAIMAQADLDREVFKSIYGCLPGSKAYEQLFSEVSTNERV